VGDPRQASAENGEKYFNAVTQKVAQFFIEVAKTTKQDFYI
jgi:creatinine amidohydrolase/Fe(II)-dependent formamide hydrolase-like protein